MPAGCFAECPIPPPCQTHTFHYFHTHPRWHFRPQTCAKFAKQEEARRALTSTSVLALLLLRKLQFWCYYCVENFDSTTNCRDLCRHSLKIAPGQQRQNATNAWSRSKCVVFEMHPVRCSSNKLPGSGRGNMLSCSTLARGASVELPSSSKHSQEAATENPHDKRRCLVKLCPACFAQSHVTPHPRCGSFLFLDLRTNSTPHFRHTDTLPPPVNSSPSWLRALCQAEPGLPNISSTRVLYSVSQTLTKSHNDVFGFAT